MTAVAVSYTHLDVYKRQVYKGDAACNFGQRLCHGVFLTKDVHLSLIHISLEQSAAGQGVQHLVLHSADIFQ